MRQNLSKLLEINNSRLAWALRLGLCGLRTQLQEALNTTTTEDPGYNNCEEILDDLKALLDTESQGESVNQSGDWKDYLEEVQPDNQLKDISELLLTDRELLHYIGKYEFSSNNDADLWNEIQRLLLRVPEKEANVWRRRILNHVGHKGATEDKRSLRQLPFTRNEYIYSGLTGKIKAQGLRLSDKVGFDNRLKMESLGEEIDFLAGVVSVCLKLIELDSSLHHALKSVNRFGVKPLTSELEKSRYVTALIDRFQRVQTTAKNPELLPALYARLDLDEAIHSLVYLPPAERYSWWGKLQQEARGTLERAVERARNAGYQVQIRPLWGIYNELHSWSEDNLPLEIGGVSGEVSACLRVYAKINDEVIPGRVLFRSSQ